MNWKSHIQYLEQLREVIGLRSYGQRDPLIEYKKEAFNLFEGLLNKLKIDYVRVLMNLKEIEFNSSRDIEAAEIKRKIRLSKNKNCLLILKKGERISRNERCTASNQKFKNCCGSL